MIKLGDKRGYSMNLQNYEKNDNSTGIKILITTSEYTITGTLFLPDSSVAKNPSVENLLFFALNCGNKFIALHDCVISSRDKAEYLPECVDYYNINLDTVHSVKIVEK